MLYKGNIATGPRFMIWILNVWTHYPFQVNIWSLSLSELSLSFCIPSFPASNTNFIVKEWRRSDCRTTIPRFRGSRRWQLRCYACTEAELHVTSHFLCEKQRTFSASQSPLLEGGTMSTWCRIQLFSMQMVTPVVGIKPRSADGHAALCNDNPIWDASIFLYWSLLYNPTCTSRIHVAESKSVCGEHLIQRRQYMLVGNGCVYP